MNEQMVATRKIDVSRLGDEVRQGTAELAPSGAEGAAPKIPGSPGVSTPEGTRRSSIITRFLIANRRLETRLTRRKQTLATMPNSEFSRVFPSLAAAFLIDRACQLELNLTPAKSAPSSFLIVAESAFRTSAFLADSAPQFASDLTHFYLVRVFVDDEDV